MCVTVAKLVVGMVEMKVAVTDDWRVGKWVVVRVAMLAVVTVQK